ncbi:hypothetical protein [Bradyrhizobium sp. LA6.12]|uniref:hypothetical protein n=1 Tax=unclassified Bradyrhizobium TaxID=2631580 RepID=UPI003398150E
MTDDEYDAVKKRVVDALPDGIAHSDAAAILCDAMVVMALRDGMPKKDFMLAISEVWDIIEAGHGDTDA